MKNFTTSYPVVGTSALQSKPHTTIIEFPGSDSVQDNSSAQNTRFTDALKNRIASNASLQELRQGSIKGRAINRSKPWQNVLAGSFFFVFALACVYFGG